MAKESERNKPEETLEGTILFNVPFPRTLDEEGLKFLKQMSPIVVKSPYQVNYLHSYGQDSPFFAGLANKVLLGCREPETGRIRGRQHTAPEPASRRRPERAEPRLDRHEGQGALSA